MKGESCGTDRLSQATGVEPPRFATAACDPFECLARAAIERQRDEPVCAAPPQSLRQIAIRGVDGLRGTR